MLQLNFFMEKTMLLNTLRKDMMTAKKDRDAVKANLLSTLVAEAVMVGKNDGNRETTESEVITMIKKFVKNADETISIARSMGKEPAKEIAEKAILETYLPKQMSESEIENAVAAIIETLPEKNVKMMGKVMAALKEKFEGAYDGKLASEIIKKKLS